MHNPHLNTIISAINFALPSNIVSNETIFSLNTKVDSIKIPNKFGVETRYWCTENENFYYLALQAVQNLVDTINVDLKKIDFFILITQSGENKLPSQVHQICSELNLDSRVFAIEVSQGCAGFIYGLQLASSLRTVYKKGLIVVGDTYSKILNHSDTSTLPIFGDGVAAILIDNVYQNKFAGINHETFKFFNNGKSFDKLLCGVNSNYQLSMDGPAVFNFVINDVQRLIKNYDLTSYDRIYLHQASKFTFDSLVNRLGVADKCPSNLMRYGNMTSASLPILMMEDGLLSKKNGKFLMCGFGVGLSAAACEYVIAE